MIKFVLNSKFFGYEEAPTFNFNSYRSKLQLISLCLIIDFDVSDLKFEHKEKSTFLVKLNHKNNIFYLLKNDTN